jgi:cyanophycinase-like exopeptidase
MQNIFLVWWWEQVEMWQMLVKDFIKKLWNTKKNILILWEWTDNENIKTNITNSWNRLSFHSNKFIFSNDKNEIHQSINLIKNADAIFIGWWDTRNYYKLFIEDKIIWDLLLEKAKIWIPFWWNSAWALLIPQKSIIWGNKFDNYDISSNWANKSYTNNDTDLILKDWLWIIENLVVDVHITQWWRLPRLFEALKQYNMKYWIWIDENTYINVVWNQIFVNWLWRVYLVENNNWIFKVQIFISWNSFNI